MPYILVIRLIGNMSFAVIALVKYIFEPYKYFIFTIYPSSTMHELKMVYRS